VYLHAFCNVVNSDPLFFVSFCLIIFWFEGQWRIQLYQKNQSFTYLTIRRSSGWHLMKWDHTLHASTENSEDFCWWEWDSFWCFVFCACWFWSVAPVVNLVCSIGAGRWFGVDWFAVLGGLEWYRLEFSLASGCSFLVWLSVRLLYACCSSHQLLCCIFSPHFSVFWLTVGSFLLLFLVSCRPCDSDFGCVFLRCSVLGTCVCFLPFREGWRVLHYLDVNKICRFKKKKNCINCSAIIFVLLDISRWIGAKGIFFSLKWNELTFFWMWIHCYFLISSHLILYIITTSLHSSQCHIFYA
jgi:hypothetical protein